MAREVVVGLVDDLLARDDQFWRLIEHPNRLTFAEAARIALSAEQRVQRVNGTLGRHRARSGSSRAPGLNARARPGAPAKPGNTALALACFVLWLAAAAGAGALGIWLAIGGAAVGLGSAVLLLDPAAARRSLAPSPRLVLLGAGAGCAMAAATYVLYPLLARLSPLIATDTARLYASFRALPPVIASLALLPVITGEELVWRGVVQTELARRLGPWRGVTLAALAYALAHAPLGSPLLVAVALLCGLAWGTLRAASGSLFPSLLAHLLWDIVVLLGLPLDGR